MDPASRTEERTMKREYFNITLLLISLTLWALIALGDILPGSLPDFVIFDVVIMIAVCGVSFFIKSRAFNLACFLVALSFALVAAQIYSVYSYAPVLYLIPASLIIAVILLSRYWLLLLLLVDGLLLLALALGEQAIFLLLLTGMNLALVGLLKRYFRRELDISQGFQDYAAEQMREARDSRAKLVLMTKQLQEYQERLRVTNKKLEIAFEQAEESRQLKARFAANVSHELRTPINLIVGFSEVMILAPEVYDQPLPSSYRADIHAVYRNAKYLQNLINDVLDISQLEARHLAIVKEKADLRACLGETSAMVAELIEKKGLDFRIELPEDLPALWFDPVRIRQILLNLLVNAVRFTSAGSITIRVAVEEAQVVTSVIDTGIGLKAEDIQHVFEEFYQVDAGLRFPEMGSGLGLTLSRELIRLHGGEMTVSSPGVPGQGSSFSFSLPTTSNLVAQMPASSAASEKPAPQKRILVLDDDEAVTQFFQRYLKAHKVLVCHDECTARQALRSFEPDVLLLAREHGCQGLLEAVSQLEAAPNVITLPMPSGRAAIRQRGVTEYLVKPVSRETIGKALAQFGRELRSIMIIDDNRDIVRLFTQTLRSLNAGYHIRSAYAGADGLAMMRRERPDLLILDVLMPGMDGFAVIESMRGHDALRDIPIILISAKGASESITPSIYGDITLTRKDGYSPIELVACIQTLIDALPQPPLRLKYAQPQPATAIPG